MVLDGDTASDGVAAGCCCWLWLCAALALLGACWAARRAQLWRREVIPRLLAAFSKRYSRLMARTKRELFSSMDDLVLDNEKPLHVLEIGAGTGANFEFFPPGTQVTCLDPNPHFKKFLLRAFDENRHVTLLDTVVAHGEDMRSVPDASVDAVVCTLVMCSVQEPEGVLREVIRVLRPGGKLYLLEHVVAAPNTWVRSCQQMLEPLWSYMSDGCKLARDTRRIVQAAGFSEVDIKNINAPLKFPLLNPHLVGCAVK
uniref:Methyltransferase-like protein 7A n=1 Tax=Petromyzon marinus TaxID=7757 RepID=A0AAJ7TRV0_PETMA|nr:methyltransferase-like protein 7A [Petromyzon marinus]